jgi:nicotinate phosphoribosyltransferase
MSHQWIMGVSAIDGLRRANREALRRWNRTYRGNLGIALTDTFGTKAFFEDFDGELARLYDGVRHDSADPFVFGDSVIEHYHKVRINPAYKIIVFSDSLDVSKVLAIRKYFAGRINVAFGIGTYLTNDFAGSDALNIVIKLLKCNGIPVVKLSDVLTKAMGDKDALRVARWTFMNQPLD